MGEIDLDDHIHLPVFTTLRPCLMRTSQFLHEAEIVFPKKIGYLSVIPVVQSSWHAPNTIWGASNSQKTPTFAGSGNLECDWT